MGSVSEPAIYKDYVHFISVFMKTWKMEKVRKLKHVNMTFHRESLMKVNNI